MFAKSSEINYKGEMTMTELQAVKKTMDLWFWLWKNHPKHKYDYPDYNLIKDDYNDCPLCDYYFDVSETLLHDGLSAHKCNVCFLDCLSLYHKWFFPDRRYFFCKEVSTIHKIISKHSAKRLYKTIRNKYSLLLLDELIDAGENNKSGENNEKK
jgi:hypothetical protein